MEKLSIRDINVKGKRVLVRVDFNVPQDENMQVRDDTRIREALVTIKYIIDNGGKAILVSHLGRPDGKIVEKLRMAPVAAKLQELLGKPVLTAKDCVGEEVIKIVSGMKDRDVLLLENVRFHAEEEENDPAFSKQLADLCDIYVNDAFGTAHRAHASTEGVTKFVKQAAAGFLIEKEIKYLGMVLENPTRPILAIIGGAKISSKIDLLNNLISKVDNLIIGGGMAYTFMKAQGKGIGKSLLEADKVEVAKDILEKAKTKGVNIYLPVDHIVSSTKDNPHNIECVNEIPDNMIAFDIGPKSIAEFEKVVKISKTIFWNGPLGLFEVDAFAAGTIAIAKAIANSGNVSVVGGGDSVSAIKKAGVKAKITHISTGGGASLEFIEGKELPGIAALINK
ncbi:MAG: phosphoglycerate kinase [Candidatus Firestonebacteria bacterium RIFOXYC2_FULL_39_67]|nr:MAG: phosphoglycerate kinase [Candidatus Firestonebacteria bacterium RIFOXYD2_FULL_39_29]OGF56981.1 MAG: phosphoglycerate kinase [Candidatus Firestonebacteria bacterium RIFOXYC2_FULL_39_67]OGF58052.1 MAG: phosphoglycerate kinase [Candidatus Firestonebacteria bacterium RifOxyC12_full_39_7]